MFCLFDAVNRAYFRKESDAEGFGVPFIADVPTGEEQCDGRFSGSMTRDGLINKAKPILFNTDMVIAILDGRKTSTRRIVKFLAGQNPNWSGYIKDGLMLYNGRNEPCCRKPMYQKGDVLYVRETWSEWTGGYLYKAWPSPINQPGQSRYMRWRPSIHMPKEAARIFLQVKNIQIEKLKDISNEDILKEGASKDTINHYILQMPEKTEEYIRAAYVLEWSQIWDSTIKETDIDYYGWSADPWIWVIEFEKILADMEV